MHYLCITFICMIFKALALISAVWSKSMWGTRNITKWSKETRFTFTITKQFVATTTRTPVGTFFLTVFAKSSWKKYRIVALKICEIKPIKFYINI